MSEPTAALMQSETTAPEAVTTIETPIETTEAMPVGPAVDFSLFKNVLEAALLTSQEPLSLSELRKLGDVPLETAVVEEILRQIEQEYSTRGIELNRVASGWRFRARPEMQKYIDRLNPQKPPRYSRAVMETLAIIAYRQPVTRGDIEEIRGVAVASQILKTLEARSWIEVIGTRNVPGKPELFATTQQLLDDLNLRSLHELPALEEMGSLLEHEAPATQHDADVAQLDTPAGQSSEATIAQVAEMDESADMSTGVDAKAEQTEATERPQKSDTPSAD